MQLFECQHCGQLLYFENTHCERCGHALGYLCAENLLSALEPNGEGYWRPLSNPHRRYLYCVNHGYGACNWLIPNDAADDNLCLACQLNHTIPNLDVDDHRLCWQLLEIAKHRLVYTLLRFGLPVINKEIDPDHGLAFDFLADTDPTFREDATQVITGHAQGLITINIAEADPAERERFREAMAEPYRTLLGHFRHEVGHYYWERLVQDSEWLLPYRKCFGDERQDYAEALEKHYAEGPPAQWSENFVSAYATAHPWEDWAETWAHYLHMVDTLETAHAFGLRVRPQVGVDPNLASNADFDPYQQNDFDALLEAWLPLTYAVNSLNRSMGQPDLYPFVLTPAVLNKIRFVHQLIRQHRKY